MSKREPSKRPYRSPRREQQALATQMAILDAAQRLFERDGYTATTIDAVATEAAVSGKTVYLAFAGKAALLRAVWDRALKGDSDVAPVSERAWYQSVLAERDPVRQVELVAAGSCAVKQRIGPMLRAIRSAAAVDADSAELWRLIQSDFYENQRAIVEAIDGHGGLRRGLDVTTAADILWTLNHPDVWLLLTGERGWSPAMFETWFRESLTQQLLRAAAPARRSTSKPRGRS